ncbi:MAG: hypothetical protein WCG80_10725 [Spirochaetales bacterium]
MNLLTGVILAFVVLEALNVVILYFWPTSDKGNSIGMFNAWEKSKADPEVNALVRYLVNWVAGTKLIFLALLVVILIVGNLATQLFAVVALIVTVATFYWRLYPIMRQQDLSGAITPKGYSQTLAVMIGAFLTAFGLALSAYLLFFS